MNSAAPRRPRENQMTTVIDLSHPILDGMRTYPGMPAPRITDHMTRVQSRTHYALGTEFHIGRIELVANTGTYVDVPSHRYADGDDLADFPLHRLVALPAVCVSVSADAQGRVDPAPLLDRDLRGCAVLAKTGWSRHWGDDAYFQGHPFLDEATAEALAAAGAVLVGIDSLNIDSTSAGTRPVHSTLLRRGVAIVEHLTALDRLPESGFAFTAAPPAVRGMGTFPVRAFALLD
jgi:kynurenine formamidase